MLDCIVSGSKNMPQNISTLNDSFAIDRKISFRDSGGGFTVADITSRHGTAAVALQGAHLLSWTPAGQQPVIWMSNDAQFTSGKSIRGGIPVCWPWFGAHASEATFPAHGFARTSLWTVTAAEQLPDDHFRISFQFSVDNHHPFWPHPTMCELHMAFGTTLQLELVTTNLSDAYITITEALHTYFAIGDIAAVSVDGLDGCTYLDKPDHFKPKQQHGAITFANEVDRVYLDTEADCLIHDRQLQRTIRIAKSGSTSTIVWNPWQHRAAEMGDMGEDGYRSMLCVESANTADNRIMIAPNGSHTLSVCYSVKNQCSGEYFPIHKCV